MNVWEVESCLACRLENQSGTLDRIDKIKWAVCYVVAHSTAKGELREETL